MRKILVFILCWTTFFVSAQQTTQYSQWSFNQFAINPALAGIKQCMDIRTAARMQWAGFEDAPISGLVTLNAPLKKEISKFKEFYHGLGGKIEEDNFGGFNNFSLSASYAMHFPMGRKGEHRLSFGALAGVQQLGFDNSNVITIDPDPAVLQSASNLLFPLIGFGAWYNARHYYVGASIDQLTRNKWKDIGFDSHFGLHTKIQAGGKFTFENNNSILPGILVRIPPAGPISMDINAMFDFKNKVMLGLGYRNTDALIAFLKVNIGKFSIGYSFDYITSSICGGNFHTHEISIQFNACDNNPRTLSACPLFE